jgi:DNA-binding CsgD family transcriptional regulator
LLTNDRGSFLTPRERSIYDLLVTGLSRKEIAERLGLSQNTVRNRIDEIYHIFDVHTQRELMHHYWTSRQTSSQEIAAVC